MKRTDYSHPGVVLPDSVRTRLIEGWGAFAAAVQELAAGAEYASDEALIRRTWKVRGLLASMLRDVMN